MLSELEGLIFPYFFAENRILGCLGSILEASWAVLAKFSPRCERIIQNQPQEPPQRRLEGVPEASGRSLVTKKHPRAAQNPPDLDFGTSGPKFWRFFSGILARLLVDLIHIFCNFSKFSEARI